VTEVHTPPGIERVTYTLAVTVSPALSPDGRMIVYVSDGGQDETAPQIWLQQVGGAAIRLTSGLRVRRAVVFRRSPSRVVHRAWRVRAERVSAADARRRAAAVEAERQGRTRLA
jgi:hypothetical protein